MFYKILKNDLLLNNFKLLDTDLEFYLLSNKFYNYQINNILINFKFININTNKLVLVKFTMMKETCKFLSGDIELLFYLNDKLNIYIDPIMINNLLTGKISNKEFLCLIFLTDNSDIKIIKGLHKISFNNPYNSFNFNILFNLLNNGELQILKKGHHDTFILKEKDSYIYSLFLREDFIRVFIIYKLLLINKISRVNLLFPISFQLYNNLSVLKFIFLKENKEVKLDLTIEYLVELNKSILIKTQGKSQILYNKIVNHGIIHDDIHAENMISIKNKLLIIDLESIFFGPLILQPFIFSIFNLKYKITLDKFIYFFDKFINYNIYDFENYKGDEIYKLFIHFLLYNNIKKKYIYRFHKFYLKFLINNKEEIILYLNKIHKG